MLNLIIALSIGSLVGLTLQRGRACTNTIFRNLTLIRNTELFLIILIAVTIELIGYQLLEMIPNSNFQSNPLMFSWLFLPLGSLIFGFGTVFAGGCAGGVCYRVGEGNGKSAVALIGFAFGIGILSIGPISQIFFRVNSETLIQIDGQPPSLEMIASRWVWTLLFILVTIIFMINYLKTKNKNSLKIKHLIKNWGPLISGLLLGLLGIFAKTQRNFSFSTIDGIGNLFQSLFTFQLFNWAGFFIIGLVIGALLSSIQLKEFELRKPNLFEAIRYFTGGSVLGIGAMFALGCNFGHIFGGIPELGLSSIIALPLMIVGNWAGSYLFYIKLKSPLPVSTPMQ